MIQLTVYVDDIDSVMSLFTQIRIYTSDTKTGTYVYLDYMALAASQSTYQYYHAAGTENTWYRSSYYNPVSGLESSLSDPAHGDEYAQLFHFPTYPSECSYDENERNIIRKIRRYIGDFKGLSRLYLSGTDEYDLYCEIHPDKYTVDLGEKGWPVYITVNGIEKTCLDDPVVQGYQYLTFSGTINDGIENDKIDIWYYTFKFSNREIYEAYGDSIIPPGLTSSNVTQDHLILQTSIDLLENMTAEDMVENGARVVDDQSSYDPSPGIGERDKLINRLRKQLDALIKQYIMKNLTGVLID